jgi:hypothetical protein
VRPHALALLVLTGCPKLGPGPQAPSMAPSSNVYLRNSFDTDPSGYLGRFLPAGLKDLDESNGMTMACSEHITWKFIDGGGVKMTEVLNASTAVSARMGVPFIAKGKGSVSSSQVARVSYTLTGKMVSMIEDPGAFAACCKSQPDQCSDRIVGEFLQGTGSVFFEASREASLQAEGRDPATMASGDVAFSHGATWQRAAEFPNPVYFAFKVTPTPYTQQIVSTCDDWVESPPQAAGGMFVVGHTKAMKTEQAARRKAMRNLQKQADQATGLAIQAAANGTSVGVQEKDWCVEQTGSGDQIRHTAHVLGFVSDAEQARIRVMPSPMEQYAAMQASLAQNAPAAAPATNTPAGMLQAVGIDPAAYAAPAVSHPAVSHPGVSASPGGSAAFSMMLAGVRSQSFDSDKLAIIKAAGPSLRMTCAELGQLLGELSFDSDKVTAAVALRGSVRDPQNVGSVLHHFDFDSDKATVRNAYAR